MKSMLLLIPLLGLAASAPGKQKPCPYKKTITVTQTTYTSTLTITNTVGATATTTETDTITQTDTSTDTTTTSVVGTSLVTSCAIPTGPGPNKRSEAKHVKKCAHRGRTTTTTTESEVSITTTTVTTTGTATETSLTTTTETTTTTSTSTTTTSTTAVLAIPTFLVYVNGGSLTGSYFSIDPNDPESAITDTEPLSADSVSFTILPNGNLAVVNAPNPTDDGNVANEDPDQNGTYYEVDVNSETDILTSTSKQPITCSIGLNLDGSCPLNCANAEDGGTISFDFNGQWQLGAANFGTQFDPYVIATTTPGPLLKTVDDVVGSL